MPTSLSILKTIEQKTPSKKLSSDQEKGLLSALDAAEKKAPLSIDLIKKIHANFTPAKVINSLMPPEMIAMIDDHNYPGQFRDELVGTGTNMKGEGLTEKGIAEFFHIMRAEEKEHFPKYNGTCLGPINPKNPHKISYKRSIHHSNLSHQQGELSDQQFANKLFSTITQDQKNKYAFLFPTSPSEELSIQEYLKKALEKQVDEFNSKIKNARLVDDKITLIVEFIKKLLRLHPFRDGNHRVFVGGLLNYLLLSEGIGICPLVNRRQFSLNGLEESITAVKKELIPMEKLSLETTAVSASEVKADCSEKVCVSPSKNGLFSSIKTSTESKSETISPTTSYEKLTSNYNQDEDNQCLLVAKNYETPKDAERIQVLAWEATIKGYVRTLDYLFSSKKIDPNQLIEPQRIISTTLLVDAVLAKQKGVVKMLMEKDLSKDTLNYFRREYESFSSNFQGNALIYSVLHGDIELIKMLLQKGADPCAKSESQYLGATEFYESAIELAKNIKMKEPLRKAMVEAMSAYIKKDEQEDLNRSTSLSF